MLPNLVILALIGSTFGTGIVVAAVKPKAPTDLAIDNVRSQADSPAGVQAKSAAAFVDSIGVNVHFNQLQTPYVTLYPLVKRKLLESGIRHIRDGAIDAQGTFPKKDQSATFRDLGESGIRVTFIFKANVSKEFIQGYPAYVAPAFEAYEFPNELNARSDIGWAVILHSWAPLMKTYVRSGETSAKYPIIGPSLIDAGDNPHQAVGDLSDYMDYGNVHAYYSSRHPGTAGWGSRGTTPCDQWNYGSIDFKLCNVRRVSAAKPIMSTESGWGSDITAKNQVTASIQCKYLVRMLLLHFDLGMPRTFIYQLVDSGSDGFGAYGLLSATGEEKPAFKAVKSLIRLMQDAAPVKSPESLGYSILGDTSNVRNVLLQKSDGSFRLVVWIEKSGFDSEKKLPLTVPARTINLQLDAATQLKSVSAFQEDGSVHTAAPPSGNKEDYTLTITDHLTVLEISR